MTAGHHHLYLLEFTHFKTRISSTYKRLLITSDFEIFCHLTKTREECSKVIDRNILWIKDLRLLN